MIRGDAAPHQGDEHFTLTLPSTHHLEKRALSNKQPTLGGLKYGWRDGVQKKQYAVLCIAMGMLFHSYHIAIISHQHGYAIAI